MISLHLKNKIVLLKSNRVGVGHKMTSISLTAVKQSCSQTFLIGPDESDVTKHNRLTAILVNTPLDESTLP